MKQAFGYLRVSGVDQVSGFGFDRQQSAIDKFAAANDIQIIKFYREEGITGKSELDGRPSLQQLIVDLFSNGVQLVLIEKLDRLARALIVQETIIQDLTRRNIKIISVTEPDVCSDDPTRTMIRQILGAFFEYERKMICSKLSAARQRKKIAMGAADGRKPYGYMSGGPKKPDIPNPAEFPKLQLIDDMYARGLQAEAIADHLNRMNILSRHGKAWRASVIRKILHNKAHRGLLPHQA
jgi:DNA invertase Pin-like site-specific DNA recombinase